jgi:hypothetical protein
MKKQTQTNSELFRIALNETIKVALLFAGLIAILIIAIMY